MVECFRWIRNVPYFNLKFHYFILNAALACVIPYLPIHAKEIGISAESVGIIYSILPLMTMLLKPLFCALADHFNNLKSLMLIFLGVIMLTSVLTVSIPRKQNMIGSEVRCLPTGTTLYFKSKPSQDCMFADLLSKSMRCYMYCTECVEFKTVPSPNNSSGKICAKKVMHPTEIILNLEKDNSSSSHVFNVKSMTLSEREMNTLCFVNVTFSCNSYCEPVLQECFVGKEEPEYSSDQFWLFFIFATMCMSMYSVVTSLTDAVCFNELGENGHLYGKQRLWGTIGWGLLSPIAGIFNNFVSGDSFLKAYQPGAIMLVVLLLHDLCVVNRLKTKNYKFSQSIFKDVKTLLCKFNVVAFAFAVMVVGAFTGLIWSFLYWFLSTKGASSMVYGFVPAVQCFLGELVFFFFSGQIISKLGHFNVMTLVFGCFGLRFFAYSQIEDPWMVLPIELLQGPTYGLFYATMASFAHSAALPGTEVTAQGLVGSAFELGMCFGNLASGFSMQSKEGAFTFFYAGVLALGYCVIHIALSLIVRYLDKKEKERASAEVSPPLEEQATFM